MAEFVNPLLRQDFGINNFPGARNLEFQRRHVGWATAPMRGPRDALRSEEPAPRQSYIQANILKGLLTGLLAQSCGIPEGRFSCFFPHSARSAWLSCSCSEASRFLPRRAGSAPTSLPRRG